MSVSTKIAGLAAIATMALGGALAIDVAPAGASSPSTLVDGSASQAGSALPNASVSLVAWPSGDVLGAMADDTAVPSTTVAQTRTDGSGAYHLDFDPTTLGAAYQDASGAVNFDLVVDNGTTAVAWPFAGTAHATEDSAPVATLDAPDQVDLSFSQAGDSATVSDSIANSTPHHQHSGAIFTGPVQPAAVRADPRVVPTYPSHPRHASTHGISPAAGVGQCSDWKAQTWYRGRTEYYLDAYSVSTAPETVHEETSSSHTMGIGVNVGSGAWSASGSAHVTTTNGASAEVTYSKNTEIGNTVDYRLFTKACILASNPSKDVYYHQVRPIQMTFMQSFRRSIGLMYWTHCTTYPSGTFTRTSGTASQLDGGIDAPYLSLSAQAGFSKSTSVSFSVHSSAAVCGSGTGGFTKSPEVGTRDPKQPTY